MRAVIEASASILKVKAKEYQLETLAGLYKGQVFHDVVNLPTQVVIDELKAGADGKYANLKPKERTDLLKFAQNIRDKHEAQQKRVVDNLEDQTEEQTELKRSKGEITVLDLQELLEGRINPETGQFEKIGRSYFQSALKALQSVPNDPKIPAEDKARVFQELMNEFTMFERTGEPGFTKFGVAENEDLEIIRTFRDKIVSNSKYLTQGQITFFTEATQKNFTDALKGKQGGLRGIADYVRSLIVDHPQFKIMELASRYMERTKAEDLTPEQANEVAKQVIDEDIKATNPNRTTYEIGNIYSANAISFKVIGFDVDGEPMVEVQ